MVDHNEAMRLADALDKWARDYATTYCTDDMATKAAALLRQQAERIAELQSAHAIAVEIAAQYAAERDQLREEVERLRASMTVPTIEPNSQNWQGMDGAIAFHLIERHTDSWADAARMMHEWRDANAARTAHKETE